jgi:hypothetical protein
MNKRLWAIYPTDILTMDKFAQRVTAKLREHLQGFTLRIVWGLKAQRWKLLSRTSSVPWNTLDVGWNLCPVLDCVCDPAKNSLLSCSDWKNHTMYSFRESENDTDSLKFPK